MARKRKGQRSPNNSMTNPGAERAGAASGRGKAIGKKLESYEDTLEPGSVDDHIFERDQIHFNPQNESDDEDLALDGEEVLSLDAPGKKNTNKRKKGRRGGEDEDDEGDDDEVDFVEPRKRKEKVKPDNSKKGRFGKPIESSDEEDDGAGSSSGSGSEDGEEGWGRQYYSRPSTRKEKEDLRGEFDEKREEERELEVREVRRLQRKAREALGDEDWGLAKVEEADVVPVHIEEAPTKLVVATPASTDPATLIRHMETNDPIKLALARDFPLTIRKLEKTTRGIGKMMLEAEGEEVLHKGLGWLHYQTLVTYATTLAFYLHLAATPNSQSELSSILPRLTQLKEGVTTLEDLDFAAGSVSDGDPLVKPGEGEEDEEEGEEDKAELLAAKRELMRRMNEASGTGVEDGDVNMDLFNGEEDDSWLDGELEEDELAGLLADANEEDLARPKKLKVRAKAKTTKVAKDEVAKSKSKKKSKDTEAKDTIFSDPTTSATYVPLPEPAFVPFSKKTKVESRTKRPAAAADLDDGDDIHGDAAALLDADASDKDRRTKSLRFHTSKIAATSARRSAARAQRMSGDEDVPYRDRKAARDAALRKNGPQGDAGEALGQGSDQGELDLGDGDDVEDGKRSRREKIVEDGDGDDADDGYYDLVKRRKVDKEIQKGLAHEEHRASKFASFADETTDGPRGLTRAIEKNRGLTPRRNKAGRNPRVKKRQAYEKAKQKVSSQRAVFKGGQASLGGSYGGEKTGISTVIKSRKF